jgi:hypothetical protein
MNGQESREALLDVGFTLTQVERLDKFRQSYIEKEQQQALVEQRHLEFLRWLVQTGRLTDY